MLKLVLWFVKKLFSWADLTRAETRLEKCDDCSSHRLHDTHAPGLHHFLCSVGMKQTNTSSLVTQMLATKATMYKEVYHDMLWLFATNSFTKLSSQTCFWPESLQATVWTLQDLGQQLHSWALQAVFTQVQLSHTGWVGVQSWCQESAAFICDLTAHQPTKIIFDCVT